jgi:arsenate reductase (glutaredoxin)
MPVTIYGIKTCDTMKKAFRWLEGEDVAYRFHDYRAEGIDRASVERWCVATGWEKLLNKSSTTFRVLPEDRKVSLDEASAIDLMLAEPTMIKRPVLEADDRIEVGFKPERYAALFKG